MLYGQYGSTFLDWSWLFNSLSTTPRHQLMNWYGCQHLYGWLEIIVYHTPHKAEASFYPSSHDISFGCCMTSMDVIPLLAACVMVVQAHTCTHWWIEMSIKLCIDDWSSWFIIRQPRQRMKLCQFSSMTHSISLGCCMLSIDVIPLICCMYNGVSTLHIYPLINWEDCWQIYGWLELMVYYTPPKAEAKCVLNK